MMGADHGAVDHLERERYRSSFDLGVHHLFPQSHQRPAPKPPVDARLFDELFGKVSPSGTSPVEPENPIENTSLVCAHSGPRRP